MEKEWQKLVPPPLRPWTVGRWVWEGREGMGRGKLQPVLATWLSHGTGSIAIERVRLSVGEHTRTTSKRSNLCMSPLPLFIPSLTTAWVQIAASTLSGNSLRQTVHTHRASVHQAQKLVAALLSVARVTAGWLPRTGISSGTLRSVIEYGLPLPFSSSKAQSDKYKNLSHCKLFEE